jgi:AcrR family transcriptional regulator
LLAERPLADISVEEVAARAGVGKASVYRRWPSKGTLAFDAFVSEFGRRHPAVDTGSFAGDLLADLRAWVRAVRATTVGQTLRGLLAEVQRDPDLADAWKERFVEPMRTQHRAMVERAILRGEVPPGIDVDFLLDLLYGPAYHRLLHGHLPLSDAFVVGVVDAVVAAVGCGPATGRPPPAGGRGRREPETRTPARA